MGQKISPTSLRVGIHKDWKSKWFSLKKYPEFLKEDLAIRSYLAKKLKNMSVDRITIERSPDVLSIAINTARPGLIIGRSGAGVEEVKKHIKRLIKRKTTIRIDIQEMKSPESSATIMAEHMVEHIEKR